MTKYERPLLTFEYDNNFLKIVRVSSIIEPEYTHKLVINGITKGTVYEFNDSVAISFLLKAYEFTREIKHV